MRILAFALVIWFASTSRGADLPRSGPEAQGVSSAAVLAFVEAADRDIDSLHSFMLVRHGHVVAEGWWSPYAAQTPHMLYSLSKSFTSTAVGLAASEGKLSIDDPVIKFFPDDLPANPTPNLRAMRLSDLLRMSTGQQIEPARRATEPWTKTFLAQEVPFKPGTHFLYNTSATYMLSAAVQKATGQTVLDYLKPRLFDPLGIVQPTWEASPQGISAGGYGLSVRTEDIAKFGQLYLQKGKWNGRQLIPEAWVSAATARQTSNGSSPKSDWDQGYGYQFWRCRYGAYRGDGAFGQYCIVLPEEDAVIAITSGVRDMQAVLNLVWEKLMPAMKPTALPADEAAQDKLVVALKRLTLHLPQGKGAPANVAGKTYVFPKNERKIESLVLKSAADGEVTLVITVNGEEQRIIAGKGAWKIARASWGRLPEQPAAAASAWPANDTLLIKLCFVETPYVLTLRLEFASDEVRLEPAMNVGFGPTKEGALIGRVK